MIEPITVDEMFADEEEASSSSPPSAIDILATACLDAALTRRERRRLASERGLAVVVTVPSPAWVTPIRRACQRLVNFPLVLDRTGAFRSTDRPDKGGNDVAAALSAGLRVLGVSRDPMAYLPAALMAAADLRLTVVPPSAAVLRRVIKQLTGRAVRDVPGVSALDFDAITACLRSGSTAASCAARLTAAVKARASADPVVALAPPFATLAGLGAAHEWGTQLLADLARWREDPAAFSFDQLDRAIVLAGPPGVGKTVFARSLARAAQLEFRQSSVSSWFSATGGYLHETVQQIDGLFANASLPSLIFLDEIDALPGRQGMDRNRDYWTALLTHLLLCIERTLTDPSSRMCLLGATNRPEALDPALIRPGRLGRVIHIQPPSADDLAAIMRHHLGHDLPEADLPRITELSGGATGAQAAAWISQARAIARNDGAPFAVEHLIRAIVPPDLRSQAELLRAATHEISHAVVYELVQAGEVAHVSLVSRGERGGSTRVRSSMGDTPTRAQLEAVITGLLAGRAGETVILGSPSAAAGGLESSDLAKATGMASALHGSLGLSNVLVYRGSVETVSHAVATDAGLRAAVAETLDAASHRAEALVDAHRHIIEDLVKQLMQDWVLSGDAVRAALARGRATLQ